MTEKKRVLVVGEEFFSGVFKQIGCIVSSQEEFARSMEKEHPAFVIFSRRAWENVKDAFNREIPYIVFPYPGEEDTVAAELTHLIKMAVGVGIE